MIFAQGTQILKSERDLFSLLHKYLFVYEYIFLYSFISFIIDPYFMNISYLSKYYLKRLISFVTFFYYSTALLDVLFFTHLFILIYFYLFKLFTFSLILCFVFFTKCLF